MSSETVANRTAWPRIALISPYSGANLGDGAIHDACIAALRSRFPDAQLFGINAAPAEVARLHGVSCLALTGADGQFRIAAPPTGDVIAKDGDAQRRDGSVIGNWLGAIVQRCLPVPVLGRVLQVAWGMRHGPGHFLRSLWFARGLDMIIPAGGGQLDDEWGGPMGHTYSLFRWALIARLTHTPMVFLSVGVCRLQSPLARGFARVALSLARYRSYRDEGTRELIGDWRFTRDDPCVPDLAFGLSCRGEEIGGRRSQVGARIAVSPIAFGRPGQWSRSEPEVYQSYITALADFVGWLHERGDTPCMVLSCAADNPALDDLMAAVEARHGSATASACQRLPCKDVASLLDSLATVDLVVASRLHGVTLSHICGRPTVAISFDRKVDAHMRAMGAWAQRLDIRSVKAGDLARQVEILEQDADNVRRSLLNSAAAFRASVESQFDRVASFI